MCTLSRWKWGFVIRAGDSEQMVNKKIGDLRAFVKRCVLFSRCDLGTTSIEYALIAVLIVVVIIGAITSLGGSVLNLFTTVTKALP